MQPGGEQQRAADAYSLHLGSFRWLFFMEGGLTCLIAAAGVYMIPDFPSTPVSWLTHDEQILAQRRMAEDLCGLKQEGTPKSGLVEAFTDWTVWWLALARSMATVGESFENFLPTLVATIGYDPSVTLLLCAPPWVLSMVALYYVSQFVIRFITFLVGSLKLFQTLRCYQGPLLAHRFCTLRGYHGFFPRDFDDESCCPLLVSVSQEANSRLCVSDRHGRLLATQSDVSYVIFFAWVSNSIPESSKRAVAMAFINTCSTGIANVGAS